MNSLDEKLRHLGFSETLITEIKNFKLDEELLDEIEDFDDLLIGNNVISITTLEIKKVESILSNYVAFTSYPKA